MRPHDQSIEASQDGSHTAFSTKYNAHYHSIYGALEESIHVFISAGLFYKQRKGQKNISILEMGFGTGLNALLTLIESKRFGLQTHYHTVESDPFQSELVHDLNYPKVLNLDLASTNQFEAMHTSEWNTNHLINEQFNFKKFLGDIQEIEFEKLKATIPYTPFYSE